MCACSGTGVIKNDIGTVCTSLHHVFVKRRIVVLKKLIEDVMADKNKIQLRPMGLGV
ncbi:hypothetical protein [Bacillus thuringiensis]|uniref:hypothetical protein n=1 Tax=Bacillus thuringiensis TaxID=1428 RepID=UPI0015D4EFA8|nr:hypothetical protein [Bacillus thuringiensis]